MIACEGWQAYTRTGYEMTESHLLPRSACRSVRGATAAPWVVVVLFPSLVYFLRSCKWIYTYTRHFLSLTFMYKWKKKSVNHIMS